MVELGSQTAKDLLVRVGEYVAYVITLPLCVMPSYAIGYMKAPSVFSEKFCRICLKLLLYCDCLLPAPILFAEDLCQL
jgi:hypothetical protein